VDVKGKRKSDTEKKHRWGEGDITVDGGTNTHGRGSWSGKFGNQCPKQNPNYLNSRS